MIGLIRSHRRAGEFLLGFACLAAGSIVYLVHRSPVLGQVPSLSHALAFSLMTAAAMGPGRLVAAASCAGWALGEAILELAQRPSIGRVMLGLMPSAPHDGGFVDRVHAYVANGHFDPYDVLAGVIGSIIAFVLLNAYRRTESW